MKAFLKSVVAGLLAMLLTLTAAVAQERPAFSEQELDQLLAPVALYPDSLLSQILMAATYPLEVVQAARWSRANPHLKGQDAVRAVESMDWDPSVKSLVAFPQVLHRMDESLDWTQRLGEAFLDQEPQVMDTVQGLRRRAERAGNLRSNEQMRVTREGEHILIEPAHPQVVYVPYYSPAVVYGPWWWPAYPPVYWGPPPGYYAWPAFSSGFFWGAGVAVSWRLFGHFDWHHRHVNVVNVVHYPHARAVPVARPVKWQHDPVHRRNVPYRHVVPRQPYGQHPVTRGDGRPGPAARHEPRNAHPETRSAAPPVRPHSVPQARPRLAAPQFHPERSTPQAGSRLPDRTTRVDIQRPHSRAPESRPAMPAPRASPVPRALTQPPVALAHPPTAHPRAAASAPLHAPRIIGNHASGEARAHNGGGPPRAMSSGRGGGRS